MFMHQLTEHMRRFLEELKFNRQKKQAASARGRAINCMELEDRILLSATPIAPEALVNKDTSGIQQAATQSAQSVAADANGNHVVVWSAQNQTGTGWDVYAQRFDANGTAVGNELKVNSATSNDTEAKVAMRDDGSFVVTWTNTDSANPDNPSDVYARRYDADGNPLDLQEFLVNSTTDRNQQNSSAAICGNNIFIAWTSQNETGWNLLVQRYDFSGEKLGGEIQINSTASSASIVSQIEVDADGYPMMVWQQQAEDGTSSIHAAYSYPDGATWVGEFVVNSTTGNHLQAPSLALDPFHYNSVVTWTSCNADGTSDIYAQSFEYYQDGNASGIRPSGTAIRINSTSGMMANSSVALDHNTGNFIVTWSSYGQDAQGGWGVYSRSFNANGTPATGDVRVNNFTDGSQNYSSVAFLNGSNYVVTWSGQGEGDTTGIFSEVCKMGLWGQYSNDIYAGNPNLVGQNIGSPAQVGSLNFGGKMWTMTGSGTGIGSDSDQFYFAGDACSANGSFSARINSVSDVNGTAGLMFREGTDVDSAYAAVLLHGDTLSFQCRDGVGVNSISSVSGINDPVWVKVVRSGDLFSGFYSYNNVDWIQIGGDHNVAMTSIVQVGLAVTSNNAATSCTASFGSTTLIDPRNFVIAGADIGSPAQAGSTTFANGIYTVTGGGFGIGGTSDKFQFGSSGLVGDWDLSAEITGADVGATAGVMFRNDESAGSAFAAVLLGPDNTLRFEWRDATGAVVQTQAGSAVAGPVSVKVTRSGNEFSGWYKTTGDWVQIGSSRAIVMNSSILGGLAVTSNDDGVLHNATFGNVSVARTVALNFTDTDVGNPSRTGTSLAVVGDTYVVTGGGNDLQQSDDQFHFSSISGTGENSIVARIDSMTNTNASALSGVMFRNNDSTNSSYVFLGASPENGICFQWRDGNGTLDSRSVDYPTGLNFTNPQWVKLTRNGDVFSAYYSSDGINWAKFSDTVSIDMNESSVRVGLAVASANANALCTATFTNVSIDKTEDFAFTDRDIGNPGAAGSISVVEKTYTVVGSGNDLYGAADQFHFTSGSSTGDGTIAARIDSMTNSNGWAMSGVMYRASNDPASAYVMLSATPENGVCLQWRDELGQIHYSNVAYDSGWNIQDSVWVSLTRAGNAFTASYSFNGVDWTTFGDVPTVQMDATVRAGLAVAAANNDALCTAQFSHVSIPTADASLADEDIGNPGMAGYSTVGQVYTIQGSGNDLYSSEDRFHFDSTTVTGDGSIVARIDAMTNTADWAIAGVMFRQSDAPNSPYIVFGATPRNGLEMQCRKTDGSIDYYTIAYGSDWTFNDSVWVKLTKTGNVFVASYSMDGVNWMQTTSTPVIEMGGTVQAGLAVASANDGVLCTAEFSHVAISEATNVTWNDTDIGGATAAGPGATAYPDAGYMISGSGMDIWTDGDQFHYSSQVVSGDVTLIARIDSIEAQSGWWSKNGLMFRNGTGTTDACAMLFLTPENNGSLRFECRDGNGANFEPLYAVEGIHSPVWLKMVRDGNQVSAYYSLAENPVAAADWICLGTTDIALKENMLAGLEVNSYEPNDNPRLNTAVFSHVSLTESHDGGVANLTNVAYQGSSATINITTDSATPAVSGLGGSIWSASWQGKILAPTAGTYTFSVTADDGVRLWINDQLIIDEWNLTPPTKYSGTIELQADQWYSIRMDYFNGMVSGVSKLEWTPPGQAESIVPASCLSYQNNAPVNEMPAAQVAVENATLTFGSLLGNAIQVSDGDACYGPMQVTLAVNYGALTLGRTNGLTFIEGDGDNDSSMTLLGSLADINAALDGMQFTPGNGFTGQVNLQITTNDLAPAFTGGPKTDSDTVSITVASAQGFLATYYDNPNFSGTAIQRVDSTIDFNLSGASPAAGIDGADWSARWIGWIQAPETGNYTFHATSDGECRVFINNAAVIDSQGLAGQFDSNAITLTAGQSYLVCVEYSQSVSGGQVKLEWSDGGALSQQVISSDRINHLVQAPNISLPAPQFADLNTPIVFSSANGTITLSNPSQIGTLTSITVPDGDFESVQIGSGDRYNPVGSNWTFEGCSGLSTRTGMVGESGSILPSGNQVAFVQTSGSISQNITFAEAGNYVVNFEAAFRQYGGTSPVTVYLDGMAIGTFTPQSVNFQGYQTESFAATAGTHRLTFSHQSNLDQLVLIDGVSIVKAEAMIQVNLSVDSGMGTITLARSLGLKFIDGDGKNDASMTFIGSVEDINAALDGLQYMPGLNFTGTANIHVSASSLASPFSGGPASSSDQFSVTVSAPVGQYSGLLGTYFSGGTRFTGIPVYRLDPTVDFSWSNEGSPAPGVPGTNWSAIWQGQVKADVSGAYTFYTNANDGVRLYVNGQEIINSWQDNATGSPTLSSGTVQLQAGYWYSIRMEYYQKTGNGTAQLQWSYPGQTQQTIPADHLSCAAELQHVNEAPVNNLPSGTQTGSLNTPLVFSAAHGNAISIADPDSHNYEPLQVTLEMAPGTGTLTLAKTDWLTFTEGDGIGDTKMTFVGWAEDINNALNGLQYMPSAGYTGAAQITITTNDLATTLMGGPKSTTNTLGINVAAPTDTSGLLVRFYNNTIGNYVDETNLAFQKPVTLSSNWGYDPQNVVDGDSTTIAHTLGQGSEWIMVNLNSGSNIALTQIKLFNRGDNCGSRLQNFTVSVLDGNGNVVWSQTSNSPTYDNQILTFNTGKIEGAYIKVQKNDSNILNLAEIQAFNLSAPEPAITRVDPTVDFNWGNQGIPAPGISGTDWSACWQGKLQANYSEDYTFYATGNDTVRLWINDQLICGGSNGTFSGSIALEAGQWYSIRMDYTQYSGGENVKLEWASASQDREVIPSSQLSHENSAPVNTVPGQQATDLNSSVVFSAANGNQILISDVDAVYGPLQIELNVNVGTLALYNPSSDLMVTGDGSNHITIYGLLSDINAALNGLTYTPALDDGGSYVPTANLTIATNDLAPALTGGPMTCTSTVSISIAEPGVFNGLLATYYDNDDFTGASVQRIDKNVNFDWGNAGSPAPSVIIDGTYWSARWVGEIKADYSETYTFHTTSDDGVRLWVNNQLLIDRWVGGDQQHSASIDLQAGQWYSIRVEYRQDTYGDRIKLEWSSASQEREAVPSDHLRIEDRVPVNIVPGTQSGVEAQPIVFSKDYGNEIVLDELQVGNTNGGNTILTVTLQVDQGSLTLGSVNGLTFTDYDGSDPGVNDQSMTFSGTITDINAALNGLVFTRSGDSAAILTIATTDSAAPNGPRTDTDTVNIAAVEQSRTGLLATFYSDTTLSNPVTARIDSNIDFNWGNETSPVAGVPNTNWSASWEGFIEVPTTANYTFYTMMDDGVRLWVNNQLLIDHFGSANGTYSASLNLTGGHKYSIRLEYSQYYGDTKAILQWSNDAGLARETIAADRFSHATQPPTNFLPTAQNAVEDSSLVFSTANHNAISVADVDAESSTLQVSLTAANGTITLQGTTAAAITISGTLSEINAQLDGLIFTPTPNYSGGATLRIVTTDLTTMKSADNTLAIAVLARNHAPANHLPTVTPSITEHGTYTFTGSNNTFSVSDPDIASGSSAVPVFNGSFDLIGVGTGYYADGYAPVGTGWTFSPLYNTTNSDGSTSPNGSGIAAARSEFRGGDADPLGESQVAYIQGSGSISQNIYFAEAGSYAISFQAAFRQYGGHHSFMVLVDGVPVGSFDPSSATFKGYRTDSFQIQTAGLHKITFRGVGATSDQMAFIDSVSIAKTDSLMQVTLAVDYGYLTLGNTTGLKFLYGDGNLDNSMTFSGSIDFVNAALNGLKFTPATNFNGTAHLTLVSNDMGNSGYGGQQYASSMVDINVTAVNDAPFNTVPGEQGTYVNHGLVFNNANHNAISVGDPDIYAIVQGSVPVGDSSFETVNAGSGSNGYVNTPSGSSWTFASGTYGPSGVASSGSAWGNPDATDGSQVAYLYQDGTISQNVHFDQAGTYSISFQAARNGGSPAPLEIVIDGVACAKCYLTTDFQLYRVDDISFSAGNHTITFRHPYVGTSLSYLDQVAITPSNVSFPVQVTLAVNNGTLALGGVNGLTSCAGNGTNQVVMEGSIHDINAALMGLAYTPNSGFVGSDILQITTNDLGNIGGNPLSTTNTVNINVAGGLVVNSTLTEGIVQQTSPESPQAIASDAEGNYVVVWSSQLQDGSGWGVFGRRFNAAGVAQGADFQINTYSNGDQMYASVAMNDNGNFVVTWSSQNQDGGGWGVYGQKFDAAGNAIGGEFRINATTTSDQMYSSVAMNIDGDYVVTWSSLNSITNTWDVYARTFKADGAQGEEIQVNTQVAGDQMFSRVVMDENCNFTIVWQSRQSGGDWDIYARRFDAAGNPLDEVEFRVNENIAGNQQNANIAANPNGGFLVTWTSDAQDGDGTGIFARQFDATGASERIYTVSGGGSDIWGSSDQCHFASQEVTGDATMIAYVDSVTDTGTFAKAGVMFRNDLDADAAHAMIYVNPDNLVVFQWRNSDGASTTDTQWTNQSAGIVNSRVWVKLTRVGNNFSGYYSTDGINWIQVGATQSINMTQSGPIQAGLAVTAWNANALCTADFKHVSLNQNADLNLSGLDIGSPVCAGSDSSSTEFRVNTSVAGDQDYSAAAFDRRGNFFITWSSEDASGKWSVYGRRFDVQGTAAGLDKRISATTEGSQLCSSVASLSPEDYLVVWSGNAPGDTAGIFYSEEGPQGLRATYYNYSSSIGSYDEVFNGTPVLQRVDPNVDYTWNQNWSENNSPAPGVNKDFWAAQWDGMVQAKVTGTYTFYATGDDGIRLWVNGQLLTESSWHTQYPTTYTGTINLLAGQWYSFHMDYFQANGPDSAKVEWSATDNSGAVILARETIAASQFTYVNQAPVNNVPGPQHIATNGSLVFSSANQNALTINDFGVEDDDVEVTLSVNRGTLALGSASGLTFKPGSGPNGPTMTFHGSIADINAALDGLQFTPSSNYSGFVDLKISTNDLGGIGIGGAKSTTNTLSVYVTPPPTIGLPGGRGAYEHQAVIFSHANGNAIVVGDPDVGDNTVQVTLSVANGTVVLARTDGLTFANGTSQSGSTITVVGRIADINAALDGMLFVSGDTVGDEVASIQVAVNDLGHAGCAAAQIAAGRVDIGITAVNDAPTITLPDSIGTDSSRIYFSNAYGNPITISDPDSLNRNAVMTILVSDGVFNLGGTAGLTILGGTPSQSSFIKVLGSVDSLNHALDGLLFRANSTSAEMQITVDDLGEGVGVQLGPRQTTVTIYAQWTTDPNFTPNDSGARLQQRAGVITLPAASGMQEILRGEHLQASKLTLERDQFNSKLFATDLSQNVNTRFVDGHVAGQTSGERINRGDAQLSAENAEVRDAKLLEEVAFSADTQNVAEPVQTGSTNRRDENILVGLGVVSAGYLAWAFNGGSLLAGAISATPMWKPFDPLAVLDFSDRSKSGMLPLDGEAGIIGDDNLQSLLG